MTSTQNNKIGLATATIIGMNAMIGAGIFIAPNAFASNVGPAGILAYLFVVIAVWFMGLSLARVAELYPEEGAFYTYVKPLAGHVGGMLANASFLLGPSIAMGLLIGEAGNYLHPFIPIIPARTLGVLLLVILVALNMHGITLSKLGQRILIVCTVFPLITTIIICLSKANLNNLIPFAPYGARNVLAATRVVIFGFFGFECIPFIFKSIDDPKRNVPQAMTYAIGIVGMLYLAFATSLILAIPTSHFGDPRYPLLTDILASIFPDNPFLIGAVHIAILSAILGTVHSMIWGMSSLFGSFVATATKDRPEPLRLPHRVCVAAIAAIILLSFALLKKSDLFASFTALFNVSAFIAAMVTLLTIRQEWRSGRNIITLLGLATAATIWYFALESIILTLAS